MKQNLIAYFIATIMFVQIFPMTSLLSLTKSFANNNASENEIELSIALQQLEEDDNESGIEIADYVDFHSIPSIYYRKEGASHFAKNDNNCHKGYISILEPPPNEA